MCTTHFLKCEICTEFKPVLRRSDTSLISQLACANTALVLPGGETELCTECTQRQDDLERVRQILYGSLPSPRLDRSNSFVIDNAAAQREHEHELLRRQVHSIFWNVAADISSDFGLESVYNTPGSSSAVETSATPAIDAAKAHWDRERDEQLAEVHRQAGAVWDEAERCYRPGPQSDNLAVASPVELPSPITWARIEARDAEMREAILARVVRESGAIWDEAQGCYVLLPGFSELRPNKPGANEEQDSDLELPEIVLVEEGVAGRGAERRIPFGHDEGNDLESNDGCYSSSSGFYADDEVSETDILEAFTEMLRAHGPGRLVDIGASLINNNFSGMTLAESPFHSPFGSSSSAHSPRQTGTEHLIDSDLETEEQVASALDYFHRRRPMAFRPGAHRTVSAISQASLHATTIQFQRAEIVDVVPPPARPTTERRVMMEEVGSAQPLELVSSPGSVYEEVVLTLRVPSGAGMSIGRCLTRRLGRCLGRRK